VDERWDVRGVCVMIIPCVRNSCNIIDCVYWEKNWSDRCAERKSRRGMIQPNPYPTIARQGWQKPRLSRPELSESEWMGMMMASK